MISISDKLYVTKEINTIVLKYANENILRPFLFQFSFKKNKNEITDLLEILNSWDGDNHIFEDYETGQRVMKFILKFLKNLSDSDIYALYYWVINLNYEKYTNEIGAEVEEDDDTIEEYGSKIGRKFAEKMYFAKQLGLLSDLEECLVSFLITFASEFDFSLIDDETVEDVKEKIKGYSWPRYL